jgi:hypothetical protein
VARLVNAFGLVLLLVLSTFVLLSLLAYKGWTGVCIALVTALTGTVALATARARHDVLRWAGRIAALSVLLAVVGAFSDERAFFGASALLNALVLLVGALAVLRAVLTEERVGFRTILGAVSVYISLGILFAFLYVGLDKLQGRPFFGHDTPMGTGDFPYFSIVTLTTTGYGDFTPAGQPGRMFAVLEMLMGQVFLVTLIARLVSLWRPGAWLREGAGIAEDPTEDGL